MSVINPPGLPALLSSSCICFTGAAEAAGVNAAAKKARQLQALKVQEGDYENSTSLETGRQDGSVYFCLQKNRRTLVLTCQDG